VSISSASSTAPARRVRRSRHRRLRPSAGVGRARRLDRPSVARGPSGTSARHFRPGLRNFAFASARSLHECSTITVVALHRPSGRARQVDKVVQEANDAQDDHHQGRDVIVDHYSNAVDTASYCGGDCVSAIGLRNQRQCYRLDGPDHRTSGSTCSTVGSERCRFRWMSSRAGVDGSVFAGRSRRGRCRGSSAIATSAWPRPQVGAPLSTAR